jgi:O-antigen ligase
MVTDIKRFWITELGTILVFGGFFLLSNFAHDITKLIKYLINTMIFVTLFGYYQFIGDLWGLPTYLTGLRETYTKIVFGVPRIHATAIEPLYFAGMLFICLFTTVAYYFLDKRLISDKLIDICKLGSFSNQTVNFLLFIFFFGAFLLTISKSAIVILVTMLPFFLFIMLRLFSRLFSTHVLVVIKKLRLWLILIGCILVSMYSYTPALQQVIQNISSNFVDTIYGQSASSGERAEFLKAFDEMIVNNRVLGIGSGHYGVEAGNYIQFESGVDNYLIVNNVYLEVWLEHGLIPFLTFLAIIATLIYNSLKKMLAWFRINKEQACITASLAFTLIAYCFQWLTFSPIFIMPIFIIMGLMARNLSEAAE